MAGYFLSSALFEVYTKYQGKKIKIFRNTEFDVVLCEICSFTRIYMYHRKILLLWGIFMTLYKAHFFL